MHPAAATGDGKTRHISRNASSTLAGATMNPITQHVKANARLRRKIDRLEGRIAAMKSTTANLVTLADFKGFGDHPITVRAAAEIGWVRMTPEQRDQLVEKLTGLHGETHAEAIAGGG